MNNYFSDWYRSASISPEGIPLVKRWDGAASFEVDAGEIGLLAQVFYQLNPSDSSFPERFRKSINESDPTFPMSGNDRELIVLAGAALVDAMERGARDIADLTALFLVCGAVQNVRSAIVVPGIPEIAVKYLSRRSVERAKPEKDGKEEELSKALVAAGEPYSKLAPAFQRLQLEFPIVSEEANILWWLISETSRDVDQRWNKMPLGMACVLTGKELADLTQIIPGPIAARAFLDRAIRSGRKKVAASTSIADVVNETDKTWRGSHFSKPVPNGLEGILPLTHAVVLSVQASDGAAWQPIFKTATDIGATAKKNPDLMAYQFYLEQLAARSFIEIKES
ncbi:MAG: GTPase-associated system all-helical protein GASH [Candidatus Acidiferrales bacterium]